jgi:hypothetical protein
VGKRVVDGVSRRPQPAGPANVYVARGLGAWVTHARRLTEAHEVLTLAVVDVAGRRVPTESNVLEVARDGALHAALARRPRPFEEPREEREELEGLLLALLDASDDEIDAREMRGAPAWLRGASGLGVVLDSTFPISDP